MASLMLMHTLIQTLVQLKHSSHVHPRSVGDAEASEGSRDSTPQRWSLLVPMCSYGQGSIREASGTTLGVLGTETLKGNKRFYGFTDFRGKPARRGRGRPRARASIPSNQVVGKGGAEDLG